MKRSLTINACLILVGWWLNATVSQAVNPQMWLMARNDSYRKYQCVTGSAGILSPIVCSHLCCFQHRCIGMFFNELTSECLVINATEKAEPCGDLNWANWTPYRKNKGTTDTCSDYLMHAGGYGYRKLYPGGAIADVHGDLYYTPASSGEVGGHTLSHPDSYEIGMIWADMKAMKVIFDNTMSVRGIATQGRWRNESLSSCCDERVTAYHMQYSVDCEASWLFHYVDSKRTFEANVIPDAGNEVVENMFDTPVAAKCFLFYSVDYQVNSVIRWDLIGCAIN